MTPYLLTLSEPPFDDSDESEWPVNDQLPATKLHDSPTIPGTPYVLPEELLELLEEFAFEERIRHLM